MPIAAGTTLCLIEHLNSLKHSLLMTCNHHLCNAFPILYDKVLLRQIDKHDAYLTAIVGIDCPGGIQDGDTFLQGQSTTWTDLCFVALRQRNIQTGWNEPALQRLQGDWRLQISPQIHSRTLCGGILRQRLMSFVDNLNLEHTFKISF